MAMTSSPPATHLRCNLFDAHTLAPIGEAITFANSETLDGWTAHVSADRKYAGLVCDGRALMYSLDPREWRRVALQRAAPGR